MQDTYSSNRIILQKLTVADALPFYTLYTYRKERTDFTENPFRKDERPAAFTERIIALCECIFTVRIKEKPEQIIGDCALHDWDPATGEIEIGGSLFPEFWGLGLMHAAFELLIGIAKNEFLAKAIIGKTNVDNRNAIRLVQKMGFQKDRVSGNGIIMRKQL
ncbi:hypothetical protein A8C56_21680 [Niabella ginsenosidivorans]|uniref:N-acetyltransferase domain-containing protein n=1 Tax=Niabella ginsenosidivorans TaxID=1176587 RepID=A0A1A9I950_9BACT|nr:GNAT family N-acetyltransferase [Niabella ginsenosidivorans]ANH83240.1 hypothetical protein A8C56_21680 [Niabella ginsenosidivorans]